MPSANQVAIALIDSKWLHDFACCSQSFGVELAELSSRFLQYVVGG
jgi:hypothetical protein